MLTWMLPLSLSAMDCKDNMTASTASNGNVFALDNSTHTNCVDAVKATWAIEKIHFYTDQYCSLGKQTLTLLDTVDAAPAESDKQNYADNPSLGSGTIANGTYNCLAVKIWDNVTFRPATTSTSGACDSNTDYTTDICGGDSYLNPDTGVAATCALDASPASEWKWIYMSTISTDLAADDNCGDCDGYPPTAIARGDSSDNLTAGITLGAPLIISAAKTSTFNTNINKRIYDSTLLNGWTAECGMLKPAFTFN